MVNAPALSDEERRHWNEHGYLLIESCLNDEEVARLTGSLSELAERSKNWSDPQRASNISFAGNKRDLDIIGLPFVTRSVDFLMDHTNVFGKILSLMGPYIYIPGMEYLERYSHDDHLIRLHTDGGGSFRSIFPSSESLVLQLKVQFFLTDTDKPDSGNFMMVPASHRRKFPVEPKDIDQATRTAVPVLARKGDALIFPWSLWHCVAPNRSSNVRRSIITRYAQLWMRPVDYDHTPDELSSRLTPRRRRLLASMPECRTQNDYYHPNFEQQLDEMFGNEWNDHPELARHNAMKKPLKQLFDQ